MFWRALAVGFLGHHAPSLHLMVEMGIRNDEDTISSFGW